MDAPQPYRTAAMCNLIAGAFNIIVNGMWCLALISSCVGVIALPLPMIAMAIGAWQMMVGFKMNSGERVQNASMVAMAGAATGFFSASWLSTGLGIFAYLQVEDADSKAYLAG